MTTSASTLKICSADLQDGIEFEIACERINMLIAHKVAEMDRNGTSGNPTEADLAELRLLTNSRKRINGATA